MMSHSPRKLRDRKSIGKATPVEETGRKSQRVRERQNSGAIQNNTPIKSPIPVNENSRRSKAGQSQTTKSAKEKIKVVSEYEEMDIDEEGADLPCPKIETLPCREDQFEEIWSSIRESIDSRTSKSLYVSGVPGTGKTLVVRAVLDRLEKSEEYHSKFKMVYINGLTLSSPDKIWKRFYNGLGLDMRKLKGRSSHSYQKRLESYFEIVQRQRIPIILVVDELDQLIDSKQQSILYSLLEWTSHPHIMLTLIAIFNTMNLPENVLAQRNESRMGFGRIVFSPYTHEELSKIIQISILKEDENKSRLLTKDGLTLLAKKVANLSGDARRALEITKKTLEILDRKNAEGKKENLKENAMRAVNEAFTEIFSSPKILWLKNCSDLEKLFIKTLANILHSSGEEDTTIRNVQTLIISEGIANGTNYTTDHILHVVNKLFAMKLILLEDSDFPSVHRKITLTVTMEDINFAFKEKD